MPVPPPAGPPGVPVPIGPASGSPGVSAPPAPPPAGPPGVSAPPGPIGPVSGPPVSPAGPASVRRRWYLRPVAWIAAGAAVLVLIAATVVTLLLRQPYPEVTFASVVTEVARVSTDAKSVSYAFTAVNGNQAYLGYVQEDGLHLIGYDLGARTKQWDTKIKPPAASSVSWDGLVPLPGGVIAAVNGYSGERPYTLVYVDSSGSQRWQHAIEREESYLVTRSAVVVIDKLGHQLIGLDPGTGKQKWSVPDIKDQYGYTSDAIYPVLTKDDVAGPAGFRGLPPGPIGDGRIVELSIDSSARVINTATGEVSRSKGNIGDPRRTTVLAYAGRLFLAPDTGGYQLFSYELDTLGPGKLVYAASDPAHRLDAISPCGDLVCLLDHGGVNDHLGEILAVDPAGPAVKWHQPVKDADILTPVGDGLMVQNTNSSARYTTVFDGNGAVLLGDAGKDQTGVRLTGGSVLLFTANPQTYPGDQGVYGFSARTHTRTPLGDIKKIRTANCSWNTELLICPSDTDFGVWRFAA
jgi:hypothetical protein